MTEFKRVEWQPGRWLDFSDMENIVVRDANNKVVAADLYITEADAAKLKAKVKEMLADRERKDH